MTVNRIDIRSARISLEAAPGQTILEAALAAGVAYPHGCRSGRCGSCKSRLIEGETDLLPHSRFALTEAEKTEGLILACRALPLTDTAVAWLGIDEAEAERSRSIILATDNQLIGTPIFTLAEGAEFIAERQIGLVGIYSGEATSTSSQEQKEFRDVVATHDGLYFQASDPAAVDAIIDRIQSQQAVDLDATPEVVITDRPAPALWVLAGAFVERWLFFAQARHLVTLYY